MLTSNGESRLRNERHCLRRQLRYSEIVENNVSDVTHLSEQTVANRRASSGRFGEKVRREKALDFSGCKSRPGTGSLHPVAIEAAAEATKLSELSVERRCWRRPRLRL
jgi:hypothetical protein